MQVENETDISDALRRFDHMAGLDPQTLADLAGEIEVQHASSQTEILSLGSEDSRLLFLLDGELRLVAGDGGTRTVRHTDPAALGPVSRLRPSRYRVVAQSDVSYLMIEQQLLDRYVDRVPGATVVVEEALVAGNPDELLDDNATHPIMFDVFDDLNHGRIIVPSDPEVAVQVGRSLPAAGSDTRRLAETLSACPALTLKIVRAAMAVDSSRRPIRSIRDAVERLDPERTFHLSVQCLLRETLRTDVVAVRERMHSWWERTMRVAAISAVLARMSERFDPEFARLVGLFHGIAEPVLLGYADRHDDLHDPTTLDNVIYDNRAQLGRILSILWGLPRDVVDATTLCNHWGYDHAGEADFTDILMVAQWHAMIGGDRNRRMPTVKEIPAFDRLGLQSASPELSLKIVETANNAIGRAGVRLHA